MASLISWLGNKKKEVQRGVDAAVAQVNPLDNGRTYRTVMDQGAAYTPKAPSSVMQQATHNGLSNVVGGVTKPLIRGGIALNQGTYNLTSKAMGQPTLNADQFMQQSYGRIPGFNRAVGYTGTKRQIIGDTISNVANVAAPGSSKLLTTGVSKVLPKVIPKIIPKAVSSAAVGAPVGAVSNTGSYLSSDVPITREGLIKSAKEGAIVGAAGGAALPVIGAAAKASIPVVKAGAKQTVKAAKAADQKAFTTRPQTVNVPINNLVAKDLQGYGDISQPRVDYYRQALQKGAQTKPIIAMKGPDGKLYVEDGKHRLIANAQEGKKTIKVKVVPNYKEAMAAAQGGYARIPGGKLDPAADLSSAHKEFINDYAEMLEGMDASNGVSILPDGTRASSNSPFYRQVYAEKARPPTKAEWFAESRRQIESGKGAYGASEEFAKLPNKKRLTPPTRDTERAMFDQNPMSVGNVLKQNKRIEKMQTQNKKINADFQAKGAELPELNTKRVSLGDKALRSTRSIIERQGESGKQLGGMLQGARDTQEIYLGQLQKSMPTVMQLARKGRNALVNKDFENFVDATQGLAKPKNAKVAQAVQEWQATHPGIRLRAVDAGLDVGDLGPTYYPHFIDYEQVFKDTNTYNKAINHLVESGQAPNADEAIRLLGHARDVSRNRQFGNLEASRLVDLPFYDKTPNSLISYLNGSSKRIAQTETFGKQDENALKLIAKAGQEGYDTEAMKNAYDIAVGARKYNPTSEKVSGNIRKYVTTTRLGLGALTNVSQNVNTGIVTGHMRTMGAMLKQLDPKTRAFVEDTGVVADAVLNDVRTQAGFSNFSQKVLGKAVNKITAPGFGAVEKFNRSVSATAGRDYALRLAQTGDEATLRKLGVTGDIKGNTLTEAQQIQAARKVVEKTQFKVDPQDLPGWADSPGGKLVSQFRTFSYNQGKFFSNEIIKPLGKGNAMPLARLMAALPLGYALYETKRAIAGRPEEENNVRKGADIFGNVGGAGLAFDLYRSLNPLGSKYLPSDRRVSMALGAFGGPTAGVASQAVGAVSEAIQRKNTPSDESRLEGKVAVGKTGDSYTDLTPLSRFGLQQVPIVGTGTANRLLPYKKESNADAGKPANAGDLAVVNNAKVEDKEQKEIINAAFNSADGKLFIQQSDEAKKILAKQDPERWGGMNKQYEALKKQFSTPEDLPKDLDEQSTATLTKYNRLTTEAKEARLKNEKGAEYELAAADYQRDKLSGKLTSAQDIRRQAELSKLAVGKDFDTNVRELFGLNKTQLADFLEGSPDGQRLASQLLAYDDALTKAGLQENSKLRDKYGNVSIRPKAKGSGAARSKTKAAIASAIKTPSIGRVRQSTIQAKRPSIPKFTARKPKTPKVTRPRRQIA